MQRVPLCSNPRAFPPTIGNTSIALDHRHDEHFAHGIPDGVHSLSCERLQRRRARATAARHHLARRRRGSHPGRRFGRGAASCPPRSQGSRPSADRYPDERARAAREGDDIPRAAGRSLVVSPRRRRARRRPSSDVRRRYFPANRCAPDRFCGATSRAREHLEDPLGDDARGPFVAFDATRLTRLLTSFPRLPRARRRPFARAPVSSWRRSA